MEKELGVRKASGVSKPLKAGDIGALTWAIVEGVKTAQARLVANGLQDPDLKEGVADASGCVTLRSPHLRVISLAALKKWELGSLSVRNAFH